MEWLGLVIATGIFSAAWGTFWNWFLAVRDTAKNAKFVALRAAIALERYAVKCWPVSYSGDEHFRETGTPYFKEVPELTGLPEDKDWVGVEISLANDALSLVNRIASSRVSASHAEYFEGNPFDYDAEALKRGREAWSIAAQLRATYKLPAARELGKKLQPMLQD